MFPSEASDDRGGDLVAEVGRLIQGGRVASDDQSQQLRKRLLRSRGKQGVLDRSEDMLVADGVGVAPVLTGVGSCLSDSAISIVYRTGGRDSPGVSGLPPTCRERVQSRHAELLEVANVSRDYSQVMDEGSCRNHAVLQ